MQPRQDPYECLFSFICSSNNNIARITQLLTAIRTSLGKPLIEVRGKMFHEFPDVDTLASTPEDTFRRLGLGYRAPFVCASAAMLRDKGGLPWLLGLRDETVTRAQAQKELLEFAGIFMLWSFLAWCALNYDDTTGILTAQLGFATVWVESLFLKYAGLFCDLISLCLLSVCYPLYFGVTVRTARCRCWPEGC
jgi:hypothetical protein